MALFVVDAITTALLGLLVYLGLPNGRKAAPGKAGWSKALRHMKRNRRFQAAVFASFCIAMVFWQMSSSYGLQVTEGAALGGKTYGMLLALNGLMVALFELPLTSLTRRFSPARVMAVGYAVVGIGMAINLVGANLPVLVVSMVIFTLGEMIALPIGQSYIAELAPEKMRGRYMGALGVAWSGATMLGPAGGVALFEWSPAGVWIASLLVSMTAAITILSTLRGREAVVVSHPAKSVV
jgi:MFS family permease